MAVRIQKRRGTAAQWTAENPILLIGEPGYETDTGKEKTGDGVTAWNSLPYSGAGSGGAYPDKTFQLAASATLTLAQQGFVTAIAAGLTFTLPATADDGTIFKFLVGAFDFDVDSGGAIVSGQSSPFRVTAAHPVSLIAVNITTPTPALVWFVYQPLAAGTYDPNVEYRLGEIVIDSGDLYISKADSNKGNATSDALKWTPVGGGGGEVNDGANVGAGQGIFRDKTGVTLNFKTLTAGANISFNPSADELEIAASGVAEASGSGSIPEANISWVGGTAPTSFVSATYSWRRIGNIVMLRVAASYSTAGSGNTAVNIDFTGITLPSSQGALQPGSAAILHDVSPFVEAAPAVRIYAGDGILRAKFAAVNASAVDSVLVWEWNG
jgi:uncharacterized protein YegP (UPF0339 family)